MERRKFVIGLGSLVAGGAAATGTGAFTQARMERSVTVQVAGSDENGAVALSPNDDLDSVSLDGNNELEIDLSDSLSGAAGMNPNSTLWIGGNTTNPNLPNLKTGEGEVPSTDGQIDSPAFTIENQSTSNRRIRIKAEAISLPGDSELAALFLESGPGGGSLSLDTEGEVAETDRFNIGTGQTLTVALVFESGTTQGDIEIDMTIYADDLVS